MHTKIFLILLLTLTFLPSCSTVRVSQDFDTEYSFSGLRTYDWNTSVRQNDDDLLLNDELMAKRFYEAIDDSMQERGFTRSDQPDLLVSCYYTVSKQIVGEPVLPSIGFGFGRRTRFSSVGMDVQQTYRQFNQGELIIELHEPKDNHLIWKGKGTHEVYTHNDPAKLTQTIADLVAGVLNQFPPLPQ